MRPQSLHSKSVIMCQGGLKIQKTEHLAPISQQKYYQPKGQALKSCRFPYSAQNKFDHIDLHKQWSLAVFSTILPKQYLWLNNSGIKYFLWIRIKCNILSAYVDITRSLSFLTKHISVLSFQQCRDLEIISRYERVILTDIVKKKN